MKTLFENRTEAGAALAARLASYSGSRLVALGMSKGGTLLACEIARRLGGTVDLMLLRTLVLPYDQRTVVGAVGPEGACVLEEDLIDSLNLEGDAIETLRHQARSDLDLQDRVLRGSREPPEVLGRTVVLVDDFVASTVKVRAALLYLHSRQPREVIVAAPMVTQSAMHDLRLSASEWVSVGQSESIPEMERIYAKAEIPSDAEVRHALGVDAPSDDLLARLASDEG